MKRKASPRILEIYRINKERLASELQKDVKDRATHNSIAAFSHIVRHMEEVYELV